MERKLKGVGEEKNHQLVLFLSRTCILSAWQPSSKQIEYDQSSSPGLESASPILPSAMKTTDRVPVCARGATLLVRSSVSVR